MKWDQYSVKALRNHMGFTQAGFAAEIGVRQQTVSEWEHARQKPRGATVRLLDMAKAKSGFTYQTPEEANATGS